MNILESAIFKIADIRFSHLEASDKVVVAASIYAQHEALARAKSSVHRDLLEVGFFLVLIVKYSIQKSMNLLKWTDQTYRQDHKAFLSKKAYIRFQEVNRKVQWDIATSSRSE